MLPTIRALLFSASALALAACGDRNHDGAHAATNDNDHGKHATPAPPAEKAHGSHDPSHGGLVLMDGHDHHAELVIDVAAGTYRIYVSDSARNALPASTFDTVAVAVTPGAGVASEVLAMTRAADDTHWAVTGKPIATTGAKVKLTYGKGGIAFYDVELPIEYILTGKMPAAAPPTPAHAHKDDKKHPH